MISRVSLPKKAVHKTSTFKILTCCIKGHPPQVPKSPRQRTAESSLRENSPPQRTNERTVAAFRLLNSIPNMKFISYDILFCVTPVSVQTCKLEWGSEKKSFQRGDNTLFLWGGENSDPFWLARAARSQFFKFNFLLDGIVRSLAGFFTNQAQFDSEYRHFFFFFLAPQDTQFGVGKKTPSINITPLFIIDKYGFG